MAESGDEKLIAVAHHIAKTLGHSDTMTDDILRVFSDFDGRLREKLTDKLSLDGDERTLKSLQRKLSPYFSADAPFWSSSFLTSVDELIAVIHEWRPLAAQDEKISSCLHRAEGLLQKSMSRLKDEFESLLQSCAKPPGGPPNRPPDYSDEDDELSDDDCIPAAQVLTDYSVLVDALPAGTIGDLHEIAKRMVAAGYGRECSQAYSDCRREFIEESLSRLGFQKLSIHEIHRMQWGQLEDEIGKWIKAINVALRILIPSEQRLCDCIFSGLSTTADLCFMEICSSSIICLLNFAGAVANGNRAPERLFKLLDLYETVRDLMPEFELIFSSDCFLLLRDEAVSVWQRLGEAIKAIFLELENLIRSDPAKPVVPGGGVHPINRYVMNYLFAACRSLQTLEHVFDVDCGKGDAGSSSSIAVQIAWLMELLESNLEAKSKVYWDPALSSVFLMNNGRYIVQKVKASVEMGSHLGDDWIRGHMAKIRQYHASYRRSSWGKVLSILKVDTTLLASKTLREKLKLFNSHFDEICKTQSCWVICDDQLREELRISVSGMLSPAYRNFIGKLPALPDTEKHNADRYLRYSVDDVEARITELFQGTNRRR